MGSEMCIRDSYSPPPSPIKVSTIRLVDSFLEVPQKVYPGLPSEYGNEQPFSTGSPNHHADHQAGADSTEELAELSTKQTAIQLPDDRTSEALNAVPAEPEQSATTAPVTPETFNALETSVITSSELSSVRVVNPSCEMPVKHGFDSLGRKWKGQPGFLGL